MGDYYQMPKHSQGKKNSKQAPSPFYREESSCGSIQKQITNYQTTAVGMTQYICLTNEDLIYNGNLHRCGSQEFQFILRKITKDLNLLLHFKYNDFWAELTTSESLKKCLRSCLQVLPRKHFGQHIKKSKLTVEELNFQTLENGSLEILNILMRAVLFIYYRIICESNATQKQLVYDEWLLDIPKMFNLISIYRHSNQKIVKEILTTALKEISFYRDDVMDFVRIMGESLLDALKLDLEYEYTRKIIENSKNFNNPFISFTRNLIKSFFRAFDVYVTLIDFLNYFPSRYVMMLLGQPGLFLDYIDLYFQYIENISGRWEFVPEFINRFSPCIQMIRQKMLEFIVRSMDFLDYILSQHAQNQLWNNCLKTYYFFCEQFNSRDKSLGNKWETLIHIVISQTPHHQIFVLNDHFSPKLNKKQLTIIQKCRQYQINYRSQLARKHFDKQEVLQLKFSQIKSFKEWKDFQNFKSFDLMVQNQFEEDFTIKDDSILMLLQSQMNQQQLKRTRPNVHPHPIHLAKRRKPRTFPFFDQQQYNDQPPIQEDEGEPYGFVCGMEPLEDLEDNQWVFQDGQDNKLNTESRKNTVQFLKKKKQIEAYEKHHNANSQGTNNKPTKGKHTYIPKDQLSIEYQTSPVHNLKIEKVQHKPTGSIFKRKQKLSKKESEVILDENNLSISMRSYGQEEDEEEDGFQSIIKKMNQSEISLSFASTVRDQLTQEADLLTIMQKNFQKDELIHQVNGVHYVRQQKNIKGSNNKKNSKKREENRQNDRKNRNGRGDNSRISETSQIDLSMSMIQDKQVKPSNEKLVKKPGQKNNQNTHKKVFNQGW